jgi:hypothetical protein
MLGASEETASESIYGIDLDTEAVGRLQEMADQNYGLTFPNIDVGNLFEASFPEVDVLVGNPPYVIRHRFENPEKIVNRFSDIYGFTDQADLYCYFIAQAAESLRPGGRLAMIVSNSWMKKRYGEEFKQFLLQEFNIHALVGFNERVFDDLTNSICILAEKRPNTIRIPDPDQTVYFIQAESPSIFDNVDGFDPLEQLQRDAVQIAQIPQPDLSPQEYWDIWLRAPDVFESLEMNDRFVPLIEYATPKIGVQTLAKDFYIFETTDTERIDVESQFLKPIAYSSRDHQTPVLEEDDCCHFLFWCDEDREALTGTRALEHIENAEQRVVQNRYTDETIDGLHNKKRIKQASRTPWYDLKKEAMNRLPSQILLPRRVYEDYTAVWNRGRVVPNENFLATNVDDEDHVKPLLVYLNSSLGELCLRLSGQVYGGGVCDLNVSSAKQIRCLDFDSISALPRLSTAFDTFAETQDREVLDDAIFEALEFVDQQRSEVEEALRLSIRESVAK